MANLIKECIYNTWGEFKQYFICDVYGNGGLTLYSHLFRGQNSDCYKLTSSFDRVYGANSNRQKIEQDMTATFKRLLERNSTLRQQIVTYSETDIKALGQHYGMPTRLLDWSYSPYIACFFAFLNPASTSTKYVTIFALNAAHDIWSGGYGCDIIKDYIVENEHQKKQNAVFTLLTHTALSLEEYIASYTGDDTKIALTRVLINKNERKTTLQELSLMGLTYSTLFSGIQSLAKSAEIETQIQHNIV